MGLTMIEEMGMFDRDARCWTRQKCEDGDVGAKRYLSNLVWIALSHKTIAGARGYLRRSLFTTVLYEIKVHISSSFLL